MYLYCFKKRKNIYPPATAHSRKRYLKSAFEFKRFREVWSGLERFEWLLQNANNRNQPQKLRLRMVAEKLVVPLICFAIFVNATLHDYRGMDFLNFKLTKFMAILLLLVFLEIRQSLKSYNVSAIFFVWYRAGQIKMNPNWSEPDIYTEWILFYGISGYGYYPNRTQI